MTCPDERPAGRHRRAADLAPSVRPARTVLRGATTVALSLACLIGVGACQKEQPVTTPTAKPTGGPTGSQGDATAAGCDVQPGDVSVLKGGTFPVDAQATIRAALQYEVSQNPLTWKVMFLADGASSSHDLKRGDTVNVAGQTITVRDACSDRVVLTLAGPGVGTGGPASTG
ncbi:MAG: hypothetical protein ABI112_03860 [Terracoccus sp.]